MQSIIKTTCLITIIIFITTGFYIETCQGQHTKIIHVGQQENTNFTSIQEAINHANNGDTIYVHQGHYNETILINKPIIVIGENKTSTIVDGGKKDSVFIILQNLLKYLMNS